MGAHAVASDPAGGVGGVKKADTTGRVADDASWPARAAKRTRYCFTETPSADAMLYEALTWTASVGKRLVQDIFGRPTHDGVGPVTNLLPSSEPGAERSDVPGARPGDRLECSHVKIRHQLVVVFDRVREGNRRLADADDRNAAASADVHRDASIGRRAGAIGIVGRRARVGCNLTEEPPIVDDEPA